MSRVQQGLPPSEDGASEQLAELGKLVERLFRPEAGDEDTGDGAEYTEG